MKSYHIGINTSSIIIVLQIRYVIYCSRLVVSQSRLNSCFLFLVSLTLQNLIVRKLSWLIHLVINQIDDSLHFLLCSCSVYCCSVVPLPDSGVTSVVPSVDQNIDDMDH